MEISDPRAIRALAHPVRLNLLELLTAIGPATAAHCGRVLDLPQANCSFHLRQLAKYGFVEDGGPGRDRRERQWRVPASRPTLRITPGPAGDAVGRQLERVMVEREMQAILDYTERRDTEAPQWRQGQGPMTAVAVVSAQDAVEINEKWLALLEPYLARNEADSLTLAPGQRHVRFFMAATPITDHAPEGTDHESED
jgi:DNA-binding transcriptional ArsR family regulator